MKKIIALVMFLGVASLGVTYAQNEKPENLSAIKKDAEFYANVYARNLSKSVGLNKTQESEASKIYKEYSDNAVNLRKTSPNKLEEELPKLQATRDKKLEALMDSDKQKEKFKNYLKESNTK